MERIIEELRKAGDDVRLVDPETLRQLAIGGVMNPGPGLVRMWERAARGTTIGFAPSCVALVTRVLPRCYGTSATAWPVSRHQGRRRAARL
jgi:hypothetical protein